MENEQDILKTVSKIDRHYQVNDTLLFKKNNVYINKYSVKLDKNYSQLFKKIIQSLTRRIVKVNSRY